jgi:hypothetical protein
MASSPVPGGRRRQPGRSLPAIHKNPQSQDYQAGRTGTDLARALFAMDPETCRIRNERAKASNPVRDVQILAEGWAQDYPCHSMQAACLWMASASAVCTLLNKLARLDNGWSPPQ